MPREMQISEKWILYNQTEREKKKKRKRKLGENEHPGLI